MISMEEHFKYVQKLSVRHGWVAAFRYDIAVRTDVTCNHINSAPGDPSVKREEFLEDALARTNLLRDGRVMKYTNPYAKGHDRECLSPITGDKYPAGKNHNSATLEVDLQEAGTYLKVPNNQVNPNNKYLNNHHNDKGKFIRSSASPYNRDNKAKEKQTHNSGYKGRNFDENYQANKSSNSTPTQSTSKDKA